jgi:general secretion pathway protein D
MADKANDSYKHGVDAEARSNYEQAYDFYRQAFELKPKEVKYRAAFTRMRFYASASHVHKGQQLRDQGNLEAALAEFQAAAAIDPANFYAAQELKRTQKIIEDRNKNPGRSEEKGPTGLSALAQQASGPVELHPISNTPITLRSTGDAKNVYTSVGKIAGLNVLFDPDYTSRNISIELNGVSLYQALEIIALQSKTFWRPVTPNTIFVASDTPAKRKELEQSVVKTFYLGNVSSPNDLQDAVNTVRQILDVQRIQQVTTQNAIVVRGTPDQIAMAEKLLGDIDKAKPEVVVEIAVMQVRRDKARTLGIQPPTSATVALQPNVTTTTPATGTNTNTTTPTTNTSNSINLNDLAHLSAKDFQVTIPAASVSALLTDANTKLIQNPQIRALDNQKATLKIGDRIPVATGSFQPGIGGVGINPLVNTQFQYIDVGVNIDITPRIHADRQVTLKMVMEISNVTGQSNIGGIQQPIIGQRRIEHEIRLKEGEVNILGGILENSDQVSINGFPGLARIPILRYLFSQENKTTSENEIVFALIPHIVRGQDINEINTQAVDVGTATGIELRRAEDQRGTPEVQRSALRSQSANHLPQQPAAAPGSTPPSSTQDFAAGAQPVTQPGTAVQSPAVQPPAVQSNVPTPQPTAPTNPNPGVPSSGSVPQPPQIQQQPQQQGSLQAGNAVLSFEPAATNQAVNSTFVVNVSMANAANVYSVPSQVSYDPKILQLVNVSNGGFLGKDGQPVAIVHRDDPSSGTLQVTATRPPGSGGISGQGPVFTLTFMAKAPGQATISVSRAGARDPSMQAIPVAGGQAMITVK